MCVKIICAFYFFLTSTQLLAQPYWVLNRTIENHDNYYFGIGYSSISEVDADERAYINFGKMVEIKVQSTTKTLLEESNSGINDIIINSTIIESDLKLKGITITERYYEKENKLFFSLIKYSVSDYENILKRELNSEIVILKERNKKEEAEKLEEARHKLEISKLNESVALSKIESEKRENNIKQQEEKHRLEYENFMLNHYKSFYEKPINPNLISSSNAEVGIKQHEIILKPTFSPLNFIQANYNYYLDYLGFSLGVYLKNSKIEEQDFQVKLRILNERFGIYPIVLSIGVLQYSYAISNVLNFENIKWGFSPIVMLNISFPQLYSTASLSFETRKTSFGLQYFPFFNYLKGKVSFILQSDFIFMEAYKDRFGNNFILQPGLRFEVAPNSLFLMLSFEDNEFTTVTLDFKL